MGTSAAKGDPIDVPATHRSDISWLLFSAAAYFVAHQVAYFFPDSEQVLMLIWPAGGVGLAAFLLAPRRLWPSLAILLYLTGAAAGVLLAGRSPGAEAAYMAGNMIESIGCAWLILRRCGSFRRFTQVREVTALIMGVVLVNAISSAVGAATATLTRGANFAAAWQAWYVADGLGLLLVAPFLVAWTDLKGMRASFRPQPLLESLAFFAAWLFVARSVFFPGALPGFVHVHSYFLAALLTWPAVRLGPRTVTLALMVLFVSAIGSPTIAHGPCPWGECAVESAEHRTMELQLFLGFMAIVGLLLSSRNSARELAEESLRSSEEQLRSVLESVSLAGVILDRQGRILLCNDHLLDLTGWTREEVLGRDWFETFLPPDIRSSVQIEVFQKSIAEGVLPVHYENAILTRGGEKLLVAWNNTIVRDHRGEVTGVASIGEDITERRKLEKESRESRDRLAQAVSLARLGIWDWDKESDVTTWNDEMLRIYGVTRDAFTGRGSDYFGFTRSDYRSAQMANVEQAFAQGVTEEELARGILPPLEPRELCIVRPDGTECFTLGSAICIVDQQRRPLRMLGVTLDITDQKRAEEALVRSERLAAIGRLAAGVAHEFNNILAIIRAQAQMLELDPCLKDHPDIIAKLATIDEQTQRGGQVAGGIMALARPVPPSMARTSVRDLVSAVLAVQSKSLEAENIRVRTLLPEDLEVHVDGARIQQVLLNLLLNARDAMKPRNGGALTIAAEKIPRGIQVSVSDTGNGMSQAVLAQLFTPFFTTKGAYQRGGQMVKGNGLGLAVSYTIMQEHGGRIEAESTEGVGSTFRLIFPSPPEPTASPFPLRENSAHG